MMKALRARSLRRSEKNLFENMSTDDSGSSIDGTGSTTSFDRICNDLFLGDPGGAFGAGVSPQWGNQYLFGDELVSTSSSPGLLTMGWPLGRRHHQNSRLEKIRSLRRTVSNHHNFNANVVVTTTTSSTNKDCIKDIGNYSEVELMKERFTKLLLGEDMSGGGKGVCTALAISNAITNLFASVFGEIWRLEPLPPERKYYWQREMDWLLAVTDHIVDFVPSHQTQPNGTLVEVMVTNPRSDLQMNLPALRKLDAMLVEVLDSFSETEFWYAEGNSGEELRRQEEKWWLPTPKVPSNGLSESARKQLQHQKDCVTQILKAALTINNQILSEMDIPYIYLDALPKNAKSSLGEAMYKIMSSNNFNPECFIENFDFSNERHVLELLNRVEAAVHIWRKKIQMRKIQSSPKDLLTSGKQVTNGGQERRQVLADRGLRLLLLIRQKFPGLPQTILDINKIQYNKDVGQSILESYSRVMESVAFSIISRIEDVLHADDQYKRPFLPIGSYMLSRNSSSRASSSRFSTVPQHSSITPSNLGNTTTITGTSSNATSNTTSTNSATTSASIAAPPTTSSSSSPKLMAKIVNPKLSSPRRHGPSRTLSDVMGWIVPTGSTNSYTASSSPPQSNTPRSNTSNIS